MWDSCHIMSSESSKTGAVFPPPPQFSLTRKLLNLSTTFKYLLGQEIGVRIVGMPMSELNHYILFSLVFNYHHLIPLPILCTHIKTYIHERKSIAKKVHIC